MYDFALRLQPDDLEAIAAQAYMEMLEAGYTAVGEFHYLHHDPDGHPYEDRAEMARRLLAAAEQTGIGITLLPALYTQGGVGQPPSPEQRRFLYPSVDEFLALVAHISTMTQECPQATVGVALHSLRAVGPAELLSAAASIPSEVPLHIHAAEQVREIEECREQLGTTPVRWLCEHLDVDARWTFIHATHADAWERSEIARRRAVVGLCPLTEANLGDGIFELVAFHEQGGRWGIGTDSNISVSVTDELRLLEYGQRLVHQRRDVLTAPGKSRDAQPGRIHFDTALAGGAQALGQPVGAIVQGRRADLIEIEPEAIVPLPSDLRTVIDQWVFACGKKVVRNVMVGGKWLVVDGKHVRESEISTRYRSILTSLLQGA
jgi:formimidoylglutamate deiminase